MAIIGGTFNKIFLLLVKHYKVILISFLAAFLIAFIFNHRDYAYKGTLNYNLDFPTNYGTYSSGITNPSDIAGLILSDEFINYYNVKNGLSLDPTSISSVMLIFFFDSNNFELRYKSTQMFSIEEWNQYLMENASSYISYVFQKRAIDKFITNYKSQYNKQRNLLNFNNNLISLYDLELGKIEQFLINTPPTIVVNPSYSYFDQKRIELQLNNLQIEPSVNHYNSVLQDLQAQQALYVNYEGYLSSDRRFDSSIRIDFLIDTQTQIIDMRWNTFELFLIVNALSFLLIVSSIYLIEKYQISTNAMRETIYNLNLVFTDLSKLWVHLSAIFHNVGQWIQQRV